MKALSQFARDSARRSGVKSKLNVDRFEKDGKGAPLALNGIFWSVSHKSDVVAGVVSSKKVGIDIEQIKDVSDALFKRIVSPAERMLFGNQDRRFVFFRTFTAKEAVVKHTAEGMPGLSKVKIKTIIDDNNLIAQCSGRQYRIEHLYFEDYLASVTKQGFDVQWAVG